MTRPQSSIVLAPGLELPLDAVTRTFGILAVRGAGKSNTAAVMAEEMFAAGLPFVVIDPVGSWYGLRSSADGASPGLAIPIFGGRHGDIPLERHAGELVADLVVEKRLSCVLDLATFESEGAKKQFLLDFARRLYLKSENPLHLFLEEADDYIPQKPIRDELQLLRAFENIVRRGRARGLGLTLITQRSAVLNKNVLTQVETLFAMRTTGPQDRAAIEEWVRYHQTGKDVLSTLAELKDGEAWVWSPHFIGVMQRVQVRRRRTFDSGATPRNVRAGDARPAATLADVDLEALKTSMVSTIEKAKADDPRELSQRIAALERELADARRAPSATPVVETVEVERVPPDLAPAVLAVREAITEAHHRITTLFEEDLADAIRAVQVIVERTPTSDPPRVHRHTLTTHAARGRTPGDGTSPAAPVSRPASRASTSPASRSSGGPAQRILDALGELASIGIRDPDRVQVAFFADYTHVRSKGYLNALGTLRSSGQITYVNGSRVMLTEAGARHARAHHRPTARALQDRVVALIGGATGRILEPLIAAYPRSVRREQLAAAADYGHVRSKGFLNALGRLRTLGFVTYQAGDVVATPVLFLER